MISITCSRPHIKYANPPYIVIENASKPKSGIMHLNSKHWWVEERIIENTLNDTAKYNSFVIWPGRTGKLYKAECFMDSMTFIYQPYRATKGRLVVKYRTDEY